jgi:hypothetical protein
MDTYMEDQLDQINEDWLREALLAIRDGRVITNPGGSATVDLGTGGGQLLDKTIGAARMRLLRAVGLIDTEYGNPYLTDLGGLWLTKRRPPPVPDVEDLDVSTLGALVYCPEMAETGNWYTLELTGLAVQGWTYLDLFIRDGEDDVSMARLLRREDG